MLVRAAVSISLLAAAAGSLHAVVQRTVALKSVLESESWIAVVRVDRLDDSRADLGVLRNLKGSGKEDRFILHLTGDAEAAKAGQPKQLVERLAPEMEVVLFGSVRGERRTIVGFANGTWFQMTGDARAGMSASLSFTHFEPYLRRTYRGTTAELAQIITDCLAGRREAPAPDPQEPPGIGPPLKK